MLSFLLLIWVSVAISKCEEFVISSTSAPFTECQKLTNILSTFHEKIELHSTIRETNHRLKNLEKQSEENKISSIISKEIALLLDKLEQKLTLERNNFMKILEKLEQKLTLEKNNTVRIANTEDIDRRVRIIELQIARLKNVEETPSVSFKQPKTKIIPEDCLQVKEGGNNASGIFLIKPEFAPSPFLVVCDMMARGGGWTLILNRFDGSVDFFLPWQSYKDGFGNLAGEFWLGLENIHQLSGYQVNELLVELVGSDDSQAYAYYKHFSVGGEPEGYPLKTLGGFSGTAENSLAFHAGLKFSTKDKDQDTHGTASCANVYSGAWWYGVCHHSQLTGLYKGTTDKYSGIRWGERYFLKKARMLIRVQPAPTLVL